jgi:chromosome segregation ATPase
MSNFQNLRNAKEAADAAVTKVTGELEAAKAASAVDAAALEQAQQSVEKAQKVVEERKKSLAEAERELAEQVAKRDVPTEKYRASVALIVAKGVELKDVTGRQSDATTALKRMAFQRVRGELEKANNILMMTVARGYAEGLFTTVGVELPKFRSGDIAKQHGELLAYVDGFLH